MKPAGAAKGQSVRSFRTKLLVAMMLVVGAMTALGLFLAQRKVQIEATLDLQQDFRNELATVHSAQEVRRAALAERCRALVMRPRIHAALEDNALDLLYPSAKDELRDILDPAEEALPESPAHALHARFYRFLDSNGALIAPPEGAEVGELPEAAEQQLSLPEVPRKQQLGYVLRTEAHPEMLDEVLAMPIVSNVTGDVIAALVLGFKPVEFRRNRPGAEMRSGIWLNGTLHLPMLSHAEERKLASELARDVAETPGEENSFEVEVAGRAYLLFYKRINPDSLFPPAYDVAIYPLANAIARQRDLRLHVVLAGVGLLLIGLVASHVVSRRLSAPVEELAVTSEQNRAQRARAEAALETTSVELQRSARFSADASHQLKTPVTVLRAGIEELLTRNDLPADAYADLDALLHQTYRITGVVDDLLLLSRMDAGRLQIQFGTVHLSQLIKEWLDDLGAMPDEFELEVDTNFAADLYVYGEKRFITLIVQNLLENARKYNRPHGKICVAAEEADGFVILTVENTGRPIPPAARQHIFERFHRGGVGENVPGHGLGLNLARELARLHGGDLRLTRSDEEGTEFEVRLRAAPSLVPAGVARA